MGRGITETMERAERLLAEGQPATVVALLEPLVAHVPAYLGAYVLLARAYEGADQWEAAVDTWRHARLLMPGSMIIFEGFRSARRVVRRRAQGFERRHEGDVLPEMPRERASSREGSTAVDREAGEEEADAHFSFDALIASLEAGRPAFTDDPGPPIEPEEDVLDDMVSETLAHIYESQRLYDEAARVYDALGAREPSRAEEFAERARALRAL